MISNQQYRFLQISHQQYAANLDQWLSGNQNNRHQFEQKNKLQQNIINPQFVSKITSQKSNVDENYPHKNIGIKKPMKQEYQQKYHQQQPTILLNQPEKQHKQFPQYIMSQSKQLIKNKISYFKIDYLYQLQKQSQGIILLKFNYQNIYKIVHVNSQCGNIQQIMVKFYTTHNMKNTSNQILHFKHIENQLFQQNQKQSSQKFNENNETSVPSLSVCLQKTKVIIFKIHQQLNNQKNKQDLRLNIQTKSFKQVLWPKNQLNELQILQKRLWIQINKKTNKIMICSGDIQNQGLQNCILFQTFLVDNPQKQQRDWKHSQLSYKQLISQKDPKKQLVNPFLHINRFQIFLKYSTYQQKMSPHSKFNYDQFQFYSVSDDMFLSKFLHIKSLNMLQKRGSDIKQNPNIFFYQINSLCSMPHQIQYLYSYLKNLNLENLFLRNIQKKSLQKRQQLNQQKQNLYQPKINLNAINFLKSEYDQQSIGFAIHNSLTTPFKIIKKHSINRKGNHELKIIPIGILNHLIKVKTESQFLSFSTILKDQNFNADNLHNQILYKRIGYVRFVISQHKDQYSGSPLILQIWPPFYCSPIHNHGKGFGLVKVLMGSIKIQNYKQLSICSLKPYLVKNYIRNKYFWVSQNSFGIHRVINEHSMTCITLQAYYDHKQAQQQYFSFVEQKYRPNVQITSQQNKEDVQKQKMVKKQLSIYYPQNDWQNYLLKRSIDNKEDEQFINLVIQNYGLRDEQTKSVDTSFDKFIKIMLQQYNLWI